MKELPSTFWTNLPHFVQGAGVVAMMLALGFKQAKIDDPEVVAGWGESADVSALMGVLATLGGIALNHGKDKTAQSVVDSKRTDVAKAAVAPPVDPTTGAGSSALSVSLAVQQALAEGKPDLAQALVTAVAPQLKPGSVSHPPHSPPPEDE